MGVELHITRAEHWAENHDAQITSDEWLRYVESDPELRLDGRNGQHFVIWSGPSKYDEPWLDWSRGNISAKWPDTALFEKMLAVARALGAKVQDDEGTDYTEPGTWVFDPTRKFEPSAPQPKGSWWQNLLRRK